MYPTPWWTKKSSLKEADQAKFDAETEHSWSATEFSMPEAGDQMVYKRSSWKPLPGSAEYETHSFIIGDVRGNAPMLSAALKAIYETEKEAPSSELIFAGELIGVAPKSVDTMMVLGNCGALAGVGDFTILRPALCDTINHMYSPIRKDDFQNPISPRNAFDRASSGFARMLTEEFGEADVEALLYDPAHLPRKASQFLKNYASALSGLPQLIHRGDVAILGPASLGYCDPRHLGYPGATQRVQHLAPPDFRKPVAQADQSPYVVDPFERASLVIFGGHPVVASPALPFVAFESMDMSTKHRSIAVDIGCGILNQIVWVEIVEFRYRLNFLQDIRLAREVTALLKEAIDESSD